MGVYFSIAHSNNFPDENSESSSSNDQIGNNQNNSKMNRNIRSKTAMLFKFTEETKRDGNNGNRSENPTFLPLSFIEFVEKRPVSFSNTPIVVIEGVPQSVQSMPRRHHRQSQQSQDAPNSNNDQEISNVLKEIIPDIPQKFSYKSLNRELHQNFEISQYKVNAVRVWILKSNSIREKTMAKAVECCRHFDFTSYVSNQYVRVENVFSDVKSNDFQSLASALRPQGLSNLSSSPPNNKTKTSTDYADNSNQKQEYLGGITDLSKTAPISIPKYHSKAEKQKMLNIQIDTNSSNNNIIPPKTQETPKFQQMIKVPIFPLLSTSPTSDKITNLSENSSGTSSENLSENLSENSPECLSENSSELLHNCLQLNNSTPPPSDKPSISLLPLRLPALTPERTCFSSRRPCEINCSNDYTVSLHNNCNGLEVEQFSGDDDFFNYSCYSEDDRIKFRYRNSNECDMVIPGLFIGGEKAAHDKKLLRNLKITHIVNLNFIDSGGSNFDENGKDFDDDDGIDDDAITSESNSSISNVWRTQDTDSLSPFKLDIPSQASPQPKNKKSIFNTSPKPSFPFQNQQGKVFSPRSGDNDNDNSKQKDSNENEKSSSKKESESENQASLPGSFRIGKILRFNVRLSDSVFQDLNDDFWGALRFVEQAIHSGGNVLAHCRRGISRSAALCVAYLMDDRGMTFDDAIALLKRQRPSVNINQGFEDQLRTFSRTIEKQRKGEKEKGNDS